ncbi:MAG: T9SS type A sorting domain-containing protein [Sphingobacteriales bacterium]|nr:MAG: T9SS type A sorting domain-containing protein [Sphingobacteriales bacterium]
MKHKIVMLFFLFCNIALQAQTGTFETSIDTDAGQGSNNGVCIVSDLDGVLVVSASLCEGNNIGCTDVVKVDWNKNIIWQRLFHNIPFRFSPSGGNTIVNTQGNYLILGGAHAQDSIANFILEISPTGDSLSYQTFGYKSGAIGKVLQINEFEYLALYTRGESPFYAHPVVALLNTDTHTTEWEKIVYEFPWGSGVDMCLTENEWIISYQVAQGPIDYLYLTYTDTAGNVRSNIPVNPVTDGQCIGKVVYLGNGNLAVSWCNDTLIGAWGENYGIPHFVAGMDTAGNMLWQHYFAAPYQKKINRIRRASNGDIIGCGTTNNPAAGYYQGWLFRFSPQGELLWEREYYHPPLGPGPSITAAGRSFNDFTETPDGGIAATGFFRAQTEIDIWLVKTDADGCMEAGCNEGLIWLSAHEAAVGVWIGRVLDALLVYPNPASSQITVRLPNNAVAYTPAQIDVYNIHGQRVHSHPLLPGQRVAQTDLPPLPEGIYIVHLKGHQNLSAKLVIE